LNTRLNLDSSREHIILYEISKTRWANGLPKCSTATTQLNDLLPARLLAGQHNKYTYEGHSISPLSYVRKRRHQNSKKYIKLRRVSRARREIFVILPAFFKNWHGFYQKQSKTTFFKILMTSLMGTFT
jgi:hypothetical protein